MGNNQAYTEDLTSAFSDDKDKASLTLVYIVAYGCNESAAPYSAESCYEYRAPNKNIIHMSELGLSKVAVRAS